MIKRIGRYDLAFGASTKWGTHGNEGVIGLSWIRLIGGIVFYLSVGRFALHAGYWGPN